VESDLHGLFKEVIYNELEKEGYIIYVEPSESPLERLRWSYYRPDILGVICKETEFRLVLAECETNPKIRRIKGKASKIRRWLNFQKKLNEKHLLRFLLVIPPGMLHKVNCFEIRRLWEIWIVNHRGKIIHKIPNHEASRLLASAS